MGDSSDRSEGGDAVRIRSEELGIRNCGLHRVEMPIINDCRMRLRFASTHMVPTSIDTSATNLSDPLGVENEELKIKNYGLIFVGWCACAHHLHQNALKASYKIVNFVFSGIKRWAHRAHLTPNNRHCAAMQTIIPHSSLLIPQGVHHAND